ncbi:MAG: RNA polymerase sigma factor [Mycobacteriales bacterium]
MSDVTTQVDAVFRAEYGHVVSTLARLFGDISLAEEAVQDAFAVAVEKWRADGVPPNPGGWIVTTARRRAIDRLRREARRDERHAHAALIYAGGGARPAAAVADDQLRMIFTCCHPALATEAQIALTLRLLGGLTTPQIAAAFLLPEATLAQRIVRAKRKIRDARIPYRVPAAEDLPTRLAAVAAVVYLIFTAGYSGDERAELVRSELCAEAIRLARLLRELLPDTPEVDGLLALLLLTDARRPARLDAAGAMVPLTEQDRTRWDRDSIAEGLGLVRGCLARNEPGSYQIQAAINAVHCSAPTAADTDWGQIRVLYDQLITVEPTPIVALNRAMAVAETDGPAAALALVEELDLPSYQPFHTVRAELLRRLGRYDESIAAYERAIALTGNVVEREYLAAMRRAAGAQRPLR